MKTEGIELIGKSIDSTTSFLSFKVGADLSMTLNDSITHPLLQLLNNWALSEYFRDNFKAQDSVEYMKNEILFLEPLVEGEIFYIELDELKNTGLLIYLETYIYDVKNKLLAKGLTAALTV